MRKPYLLLFILLACSLGSMAQELVGKITDSDSAGTALYQAEITQYQGDKVLFTYKTFFDGTYKVKVKPNQTYQLKASYPGRKDSTVTISTDKFGTLYSGTLFLSLYKNGLRLMGYVLDREEDIPIKDAGILVRNVMTRKEDKYFTDVNGYYNVKMDFETNYTFKIDKRSPGIMNKYQDTSFNISTIGFNQALDFRFDIRLGPAEGFTKVRPQYDPYARPENKNLKPVVEVIGKRDSARMREQAASLAELDKQLNSKDSAIASINKKLNDIDQAKKDEKTALNTADEKNKRDEAARIKLQQEIQLAEAKKKEQENAATGLKERQLAEAKKKEQEKAAITAKEKQQAEQKEKELKDVAELKAKQLADAKKKEQAKAEAELKEKQLVEAKKKEQESAAMNAREKQQAELKEKEQKAEAELKVQQVADAKKKEQEKAESDLKAKQLAETKQKEEEKARAVVREKELAAQKEKEQKQLGESIQKDLEKAEAVLRERQLQRKKEATDRARKEAENELVVQLEKERRQRIAKDLADQKQKDEAALRAKQQADAAQKKLPEIARIAREEAAIHRADSMLLADKIRKDKKNPTAKLPEVKKDRSVTVIPSDSVITDKQRREQRDRDLAAMKKSREEAEGKILAEKRENEASEKAAKKEAKRHAKELEEQTRLSKKSGEEDKKLTEERLRIEAKKAQAETEQRELEAKKVHEEQEKQNLISQREKLLNDQQTSVAKTANNKQPYNNTAKAVQESNQKKTIADWETKKKDEAKRKVDTASTPGVINLNAPRASSVKVVKAKGSVKNGQTEDVLTNVSINIRRLNGIVSQEVTSDDNGNYEFKVDSGFYYLVSFYKDKFEISKQILDLTSYSKPEYTMMIQYLKEQDEFDPAAKMPMIQFVRNSSKVPGDLWRELEPIVKMMQEVPQLKMKVYGLASADEDYPMELSITRARLVADVMMESGIKASRLRINGVGSFRPRSGCVEGKICTQDQYRMDRVVMYKVIKE